jgi:hypothetical protein
MDYEASLGWSAIFIESEMRSVPECMESYVQKTFDTVGIVREADLSPISVHVTVDWARMRHNMPSDLMRARMRPKAGLRKKETEWQEILHQRHSCLP